LADWYADGWARLGSSSGVRLNVSANAESRDNEGGLDKRNGRVRGLTALRRLGRDAVAHGWPCVAAIDGKHLTDTIRQSGWPLRRDDELEKCSCRRAVSEYGRLEAYGLQLELSDVVDEHAVVGVDGASDRGHPIDIVSRARGSCVICETRVLKREAQQRRRAWHPMDHGAHSSILHPDDAAEATLHSGDTRALLRVPVL